ncbi:MAG: Gfo/Idh/MocA family oxidoreductase [Chloroflexota bacterium]|nr:Gfo/Idh/MocA family oxidoreductase [Chloroflexota bacterium]
MLRLSAIGLETTHGYIYPAMLNGYDPEKLRANSMEHVWKIFPTQGAPSVEGDARVVACFDPRQDLARRVAEACFIPRVCSTLADAFVDVDAVLVLSGDARAHRAQATPALEAGLATFVDKPFAETSEDAEALAQLADRCQAPLFCTSALRFAPQAVALRERLPSSVGEPLAAHSIGTGEYDSYAVHSLEILFGLWGGGVAHVRSSGHAGFTTAQLEYADGRRAVWQVCQRMAWQFHLAVYGTDGMDQAFVTFEDRYTIFRETAARMAQFAAQRTSPVPIQETLEIVRLLRAVRNAQGES